MAKKSSREKIILTAEDREVLSEREVLAYIFKALGYNDISVLLIDPMQEGENKDVLLSKLDEIIESQSKFIIFNDEFKTLLNRYYLVDVKKISFGDEYIPAILINDFSENLSPKDNPICKKVIVYDDINQRDEDYEMVKSIII